jgi:hypothetical protein
MDKGILPYVFIANIIHVWLFWLMLWLLAAVLAKCTIRLVVRFAAAVDGPMPMMWFCCPWWLWRLLAGVVGCRCWLGTFWSFAALLLPGAESESLLLSELFTIKFMKIKHIFNLKIN